MTSSRDSQNELDILFSKGLKFLTRKFAEILGSFLAVLHYGMHGPLWLSERGVDFLGFSLNNDALSCPNKLFPEGVHLNQASQSDSPLDCVSFDVFGYWIIRFLCVKIKIGFL